MTTGSVKRSSTYWPIMVAALLSEHHEFSLSSMLTKLVAGKEVLSLVLLIFSSGSRARSLEI